MIEFKGKIYVASDRGVFCYDEANNKFVPLVFEVPAGKPKYYAQMKTVYRRGKVTTPVAECASWEAAAKRAAELNAQDDEDKK